MSRPYPPLLPWGLALVLLALAEVGGLGPAPVTDHEDPVATLRTGRRGFLLLGNSLMFSALRDRSVDEWRTACGLPGDVTARVVAEYLSFADPRFDDPRLRSARPALVVVQAEMFFPYAVDWTDAPPPDVLAGHLARMPGPGEAAARGAAFLQALTSAGGTAVALEMPFSQAVAAHLPSAFHDQDRERRAWIEAQGIRVVPRPEPWPDAWFRDGRHVNASGAPRLRDWACEGVRTAVAR